MIRTTNTNMIVSIVLKKLNLIFKVLKILCLNFGKFILSFHERIDTDSINL